MLSQPSTRASLLLRLADGEDAAAWDEFAAIYSPLVYRLARRRGLQPADADDVVQEVLAAVARSVEGWLKQAERGPFRGWLLRIARNTAINFLTRPRHRIVASGDSRVARMLAERSDHRGADDREFDLEYRREAFRWAAEQVRQDVTQRTWEAFWQTSVAGRPVGEVAKELRMSAGAVYIAKSRVMAQLRRRAGRLEEDES